MDQRTWRRGIGFFGIGVVVLLLIGLLWSSSDDVEPASADSSVNYNLMVAGAGCDVADVATRALYNQGFKPGEFVVGEDQVNWSAAEANERGAGAFSQNTPNTAESNVSQLAGTDEASQAALAALSEESGAAKVVLLDPDNWVPAQFTVKSEWSGNTQYKGGSAVSAGTRKSAEGDVAWLFIHPEKCLKVAPQKGGAVSEDAIAPEEAVTAHRAGCGNPQTELPTPPGGPPPTTTTTTPPPTTTTTVCSSGKCVPPTTVAPPPTTAPPHTTTTQPNNGGQGDSGDGATNTTSPPTTQAPAPAPPVTSSPTTNPPPPPG